LDYKFRRHLQSKPLITYSLKYSHPSDFTIPCAERKTLLTSHANISDIISTSTTSSSLGNTFICWRDFWIIYHYRYSDYKGSQGDHFWLLSVAYKHKSPCRKDDKLDIVLVDGPLTSSSTYYISRSIDLTI